MEIRAERAGDAPAIRALHDAAFGQPVEGAIVDALRVSCSTLVSLVAATGRQIVGHILFSPVLLRSGDTDLLGMGLGPMAVLRAYQRRGIGGQLVREGLSLLDAQGCPFIVVLGHATYYPRFGFVPGSTRNLRCKWNVPDDVFMVRVFNEKALPARGGNVHYRVEFNAAK